MTPATHPGATILHGSCVAFGSAGVLILGPSASGKSALALELMAHGALLVADDRTCVEPHDTGLKATCPAALAGMIEARGIGLLAAETTPFAFVRLVIDLGHDEAERLPVEKHTTLLGVDVPLLHRPVFNHFPAAVVQYMKGGRKA